MSTPFRIIMTGLALAGGLAVAACEEKQEGAATSTTGSSAGDATGTAETTGTAEPAQTEEETGSTGN